jgi:hypothetical protein
MNEDEDDGIVYSELIWHVFVSSGKEPMNTDADHLPYNYVPTEWVCIMFVALFSLSTCKPIPERISFFFASG